MSFKASQRCRIKEHKKWSLFHKWYPALFIEATWRIFFKSLASSLCFYPLIYAAHHLNWSCPAWSQKYCESFSIIKQTLWSIPISKKKSHWILSVSSVLLGVAYIVMNKTIIVSPSWGLSFSCEVRHETNEHKSKYIITNYSEPERKKRQREHMWL